jgi:hypothetical protein
MADDTLELLRTRLPLLFAQAIAALQQRAGQGDASASERIEQLGHAEAAALVRLRGTSTGDADLHLSSDGAGLRVEGALRGIGFGHALALPSAAARHGVLLLAQSGAELEALARAWAGLVSPAARELFAPAAYGFELVITRVPALGDLRAAISLGRPTLPSKPEFTLTIDYDELEDAREQNLGPHQLFMAGKVKIDGDVAKAMMLGMTLAQLR